MVTMGERRRRGERKGGERSKVYSSIKAVKPKTNHLYSPEVKKSGEVSRSCTLYECFIPILVGRIWL